MQTEGDMQWMPIETAPKGESVLLWDCECIIGAWGLYGNSWSTDDQLKLHPTHWMPLPEGP